MLPFRVSPTSRHTKLFSQRPRSISIPQTITPDSSDSDISPISPPTKRASTFPSHFSLETSASSHQDTTADADSDMADSGPCSNDHSPHGTNTSRSLTAGPQPYPSGTTRAVHTTSGGRVPTPIYSHFPITDDVAMSVDSADDLDLDDLDMITTSSQAGQQDSDHDLMLLRRHRLPSPISEDETMISPTSGAGGMLGRLNVCNNTAEVVSGQQHEACEGSVEPRGWWKGKEKGKTGKTILSMGYRGDCEKCRTRVPGHWSHFIRV